MKVCMLIPLLLGQRCQTLLALKTDFTFMDLSDTKCTFNVHSLLKHSRSGTYQAPIELYSFTENKPLCVVSTLREYLRRTRHLRNSNSSNLFLTLLAPHTPASSDTISRWLKWTLARAGVDTNVNWSDQSKQVRGQFIRIRLKIAPKKMWIVSGQFQLCENERFSLVFRFQARDACQMR